MYGLYFFIYLFIYFVQISVVKFRRLFIIFLTNSVSQNAVLLSLAFWQYTVYSIVEYSHVIGNPCFSLGAVVLFLLMPPVGQEQVSQNGDEIK